MNNAIRGPGVLVVTSRRIARSLTRTERVTASIGVMYASVAAVFLWPCKQRDIALAHDLTISEAQAGWACCLMFAVAAVALARSAMRIQQRSKL